MKRVFYVFALLPLLLVFGGGLSFAEERGQANLLDSLIEEALEANPDLKAAEARWHMFERKVIPAQSLDDPQFSLSFVNFPVNSLESGETAMTGKDLKLSQQFPFPGKLGTKGEMAEQQALWFKGVYEDAKLLLAQKVKDAYYLLYYLDKAVDITEKNIEILDDFIRLTETKYEVGTGLQQDVLKAQVERSKLLDSLFTFKQRRETARADLNTLLYRPSTSAFGPINDFEMTRVEPSLEALQQVSEDERPLYTSFSSLVDRFKAQRHLAKLDYWPDFNLWAGYRIREDAPGDPVSGTDFVSGGVSINLPVYRKKRDEAVAEADSAIRMAYEQYNDFRNKVHFGIHDAYVQMEKNRDLVLLFKTGIVPQANQTFQSAMAAYQVGEVDFLTLLDALLKLYLYEIDYYRVLADYQRNVAKLEAESGVDLGGGGGDGAQPEVRNN